MKNGNYVPAVMAGFLSAVLLISIAHGANVLAYEYKTAGRFLNVLTFVLWGSAAVLPFLIPGLLKNVRAERANFWIPIIVLALLLLFGMFAAIGFRMNNPGNPYL